MARPKGTTTENYIPEITVFKRKLIDYVQPARIESLIESCVQQAYEKPELMKFILEHIFGKARQNIGIDGGEDGKALVVQISEIVAKKNGISS